METPKETVEQKLNNMIELAQRNSDDGWDQIDNMLPELAQEHVVITWARQNLDNEDDRLRDLAASVFEVSEMLPTDEEIAELVDLMNTDDTYPGFRAACALLKHKISEYTEVARAKVQEFKDDEGVAYIVEKYLE